MMDLQALFDVMQGGDQQPEAPPLMPSTPATLPSGQGPDLMALLTWLKDHLIQSGAPGDTSPAQYGRSLAQTGSVRQAPDPAPLAATGGMTPDLLAQVAGRAPTNYQPGNPGGMPEAQAPPPVPAMPSDAPPGIDPAQWLREIEQVKADLATHKQTQNAPPVPAKPPTIGMPNAQKPGFDWRSLIEMAGPVIGGLTIGDPAGRNGFMNGYMHGQGLAKQEQAHRQQEAEKKAQAASDYLLKIGEHAQNITDPTEFEHYVKLAEAAGVKSGYLQPGELRDQVTLSPTKVAEAKRKEISDQLDTLEKGGYNLDELAQSGSSIQLKDGTKVSVGTALDLTRKRPTLPGGVNVPKPKPDKRGLQAKTIMVDGVRTEASFDPDTGKYTDAAGKAITGKITPSEPVVSPEMQALHGVQLELARARLADEKKKATAVDLKPGSREYKVAEDLAFGKLTMAEFRSLYSFSRDVNTKLSIYEKAGEINPNFNPAAFEMGYKFASNTKIQQQMASINNVLSGVNDLVKVSDAASRTGVTALNKIVMPGGVAIGGKRYSDFKTAQIAFADELSGALGYGSATDMSREMGFNMTDPSLSPTNFRSAVENIIVPFVQRKKASLIGPMGIYGQENVNPAAKDPRGSAPPPASQTGSRINPFR